MYDEVMVDSHLDKEAILRQNPDFLCPAEIIRNQEVLEVRYYSFDEKIHQGQIVVHKELVEDIKRIFHLIFEKRFPITSVIPVADPRFHWDDELSMEADNSSGFNYRMIARTTRLSNHSYGRAIDINPQRNPYMRKDLFQPKNGKYDVNGPGTLISGNSIVSTFKEMGWIWGGDWEDRKDYQHFEKPIL